jgi:hypothetical protein
MTQYSMMTQTLLSVTNAKSGLTTMNTTQKRASLARTGQQSETTIPSSL